MLLLSNPLIAQPTFSGTVRNATNSNPVSGADLDVFDLAGRPVAVTGAKTAADGTYTISLPDTGSYIVRVDLPNGSPLVDQYYGGGLLKSQATPLELLTLDTQLTGIDFSLTTGHAITGRVTGSGTSPGIIDLDLYAGNGEFMGSYPARTAADGTFTIGALPNGTYFLKADPDPALGQYFVPSFFNGKDTKEIADPITISDASVTGVTWDLVAGGIITGTILAQNGSPLADIDLDVYDSFGNRLHFNGKSMPDGTYILGPVPADSYIVRADPSITQGYVRTYYGDGIDLDQAIPITVIANQTTSQVDFSLLPGGTIAGRITGPDGQSLSGIDLDIFDATGQRLDLTATTAADGSYIIGAMPSGDYSLRADPAISSGLAGSYYGGNSAPSSAQLITVTASQQTGGIDIQLSTGGWITGAIKDTSGTPISDIDLDVFDLIGNRLYPTKKSGPDGQYTIGPLPAGSVLLRADPQAMDGFARQYYAQASNLQTADPIQVTAGIATTNINFSLQAAGWIAGTIRDSNGIPLEGIDLDIYDATTRMRLLGGAKSAVDGTYIIGPLNFGTYHLRADPSVSQPYTRSYYPSSKTLLDAGFISVSNSSGNTGIDLYLDPGRSLSGQVMLPNLSPGAGIDLDILDATTGLRLEQTARTDLTGNYTLPPVPYGTYILRADPLDSLPYLDTYFGDVAFKETASTIMVDASTPASSLDIQLFPIPELDQPLISYLLDGTPQCHIVWNGLEGVQYRVETAPVLSGPWTTAGGYVGNGSMLTHVQHNPLNQPLYLRILRLN
jgi:hypothetical protein